PGRIVGAPTPPPHGPGQRGGDLLGARRMVHLRVGEEGTAALQPVASGILAIADQRRPDRITGHPLDRLGERFGGHRVRGAGARERGERECPDPLQRMRGEHQPVLLVAHPITHPKPAELAWPSPQLHTARSTSGSPWMTTSTGAPGLWPRPTLKDRFGPI